MGQRKFLANLQRWLLDAELCAGHLATSSAACEGHASCVADEFVIGYQSRQQGYATRESDEHAAGFHDSRLRAHHTQQVALAANARQMSKACLHSTLPLRLQYSGTSPEEKYISTSGSLPLKRASSRSCLLTEECRDWKGMSSPTTYICPSTTYEA